MAESVPNRFQYGILKSDIELLNKIGEGTSSVVFRGTWKKRPVAVKNTISWSHEELEILRMLSHRNIITYYGVVADSTTSCQLVMEYAPDGTLHNYIHDLTNPLDSEVLGRFAMDISSAVDYLHTGAPNCILHRDLKPKNIVLTDNNYTAKLIDFGTSKPFDHTTVLEFVGTIAYIAPEVIRHECTSESSDVYSFAIILWEMLVREEPYKGYNAYHIMKEVSDNGYRLEIPSSCPRVLARLIKDCWGDERKSRPEFKIIGTRIEGMLESQFLEDYVLHPESYMKGKKESERDAEDAQKRIDELQRQVSVLSLSPSVRESDRALEWTSTELHAWISKRTGNFSFADSFISTGGTIHDLLDIEQKRDLDCFGVLSPLVAMNFLKAIDRLRVDSKSFEEFPPLPSSGTSTPKSGNDITEQPPSNTLKVVLSLNYECYLGDDENQHRYRVHLDVDNDLSIEIEKVLLIHNAQGRKEYEVVQSADGKFTGEWHCGIFPDTKVECIITFSDAVRKPRNKKLTVNIKPNQTGGYTVAKVSIKRHKPGSKSIVLNLKSSTSSQSVSTLKGDWGSGRLKSSPNSADIPRSKTWTNAAISHIPNPESEIELSAELEDDATPTSPLQFAGRSLSVPNTKRQASSSIEEIARPLLASSTPQNLECHHAHMYISDSDDEDRNVAIRNVHTDSSNPSSGYSTGQILENEGATNMYLDSINQTDATGASQNSLKIHGGNEKVKWKKAGGIY